MAQAKPSIAPQLPLKTAHTDKNGLVSLPWQMWYQSVIKKTVTTITQDTQLDDGHQTVVITVDSVTVTLPKANESNLGKEWSINWSGAGACNIKAYGNDTIMSGNGPTSDVVLIDRGTTLTFQCASTSGWIIK